MCIYIYINEILAAFRSPNEMFFSRSSLCVLRRMIAVLFMYHVHVCALAHECLKESHKHKIHIATIRWKMYSGM